MNTKTHTPGPWTIIVNDDPTRTILSGNPSDAILVGWIEVGNEDARLIAAAPDLLSSLEQLHEIVNMSESAFHPANLKAHQVISKARGESLGGTE